jgi:hypothetical protein
MHCCVCVYIIESVLYNILSFISIHILEKDNIDVCVFLYVYIKYCDDIDMPTPFTCPLFTWLCISVTAKFHQ